MTRMAEGRQTSAAASAADAQQLEEMVRKLKMIFCIDTTLLPTSLHETHTKPTPFAQALNNMQINFEYTIIQSISTQDADNGCVCVVLRRGLLNRSRSKPNIQSNSCPTIRIERLNTCSIMSPDLNTFSALLAGQCYVQPNRTLKAFRPAHSQPRRVALVDIGRLLIWQNGILIRHFVANASCGASVDV